MCSLVGLKNGVVPGLTLLIIFANLKKITIKILLFTREFL